MRAARLAAVALVASAVVTVSPATGGSTATSLPLVPGTVLVRFRPGTTAADIQAALAGAGATRLASIPAIGVVVAAVARGRESAAVAVLAADPRVQHAERDVLVSAADVTPNDPLWLTQVGPQEISAPAAWQLSRGAPSTIIAVLDSGVDAAHPELAGKLVAGHDFVGAGGTGDDNGHGTAVAGVAAAVTDNGTGIAGMCWLCAVMPVKVIDASGSGTTAALAAGITWSVDHGARVLNMSVAGPAGTDALAAAIRYASARGVLLVAAAGNDASTAPAYPAAYDGVLSVAATAAGGLLYPFSNRGEWVQVAAPGCTPAPSRALAAYSAFCGTSAAAPLVSGTAALALSLDPGATAASVTQALEQTARPILQAGVAHGEIDAYETLRAIAAATAPASATPTPAPAPPAAQPPAGQPPAGQPPAARPAARRPPTVSGRPRVGQRLRGNAGSWAGGTPMLFRYRWLRCRGLARCAPIDDATARTYRITARDVRRRIRLAVTCTTTAGATTSVSAPSALVRAR